MGVLWLWFWVSFIGTLLVVTVRIYFDIGDKRIKKRLEEQKRKKENL
jgi:low temperature requirement protein LtrA